MSTTSNLLKRVDKGLFALIDFWFKKNTAIAWLDFPKVKRPLFSEVDEARVSRVGRKTSLLVLWSMELAMQIAKAQPGNLSPFKWRRVKKFTL